ncbi:MAG: hypothetical protein AAFP23_08000, partial [Pseudomonadota bacterium]
SMRIPLVAAVLVLLLAPTALALTIPPPATPSATPQAAAAEQSTPQEVSPPSWLLMPTRLCIRRCWNMIMPLERPQTLDPNPVTALEIARQRGVGIRVRASYADQTWSEVPTIFYSLTDAFDYVLTAAREGLQPEAFGRVAASMPLPASGWMVLGGLGLLGMIGWRRRGRGSSEKT